MVDMFASAKSMLRWADKRIADLESEISAFMNEKPWSIVVEKDVDGVTDLHKIKFTKMLSDDIPHLVFDAANNLRPVLDQAAFAIAVQHTGNKSPKSAKFPFGPTEDDMLNNLRGAGKDLPSEIQDLFKGFKPYKGGNNALWALNELCNVPKHKMIIPVMMGGISANFLGDSATKVRIPNFAWDREKNEIIFLIGDPGYHARYQAQFTFTVALDNVEKIIRGQNPVSALRTMAAEVGHVLTAAETECRRIRLIQ